MISTIVTAPAPAQAQKSNSNVSQNGQGPADSSSQSFQGELNVASNSAAKTTPSSNATTNGNPTETSSQVSDPLPNSKRTAELKPLQILTGTATAQSHRSIDGFQAKDPIALIASLSSAAPGKSATALASPTKQASKGASNSDLSSAAPGKSATALASPTKQASKGASNSDLLSTAAVLATVLTVPTDIKLPTVQNPVQAKAKATPIVTSHGTPAQDKQAISVASGTPIQAQIVSQSQLMTGGISLLSTFDSSSKSSLHKLSNPISSDPISGSGISSKSNQGLGSLSVSAMPTATVESLTQSERLIFDALQSAAKPGMGVDLANTTTIAFQGTQSPAGALSHVASMIGLRVGTSASVDLIVSPPALGPITAHFTVDSKGLTVVLLATHAQTSEILGKHLVQLGTELSNVTGLSTHVDLGGSGFGHTTQQWQSNQHSSSGNDERLMSTNLGIKEEEPIPHIEISGYHVLDIRL